MSKQIKYIAHCIEDGELFTALFKTKVTDKEKLKEMGGRLAMGWGAECIKVVKDDDQSNLDEVYDIDKGARLQ